jgi:hypothetical protein
MVHHPLLETLSALVPETSHCPDLASHFLGETSALSDF